MAEVKHPLAWFEFVFDPTGTLLENHLKDAFAVPSAAQLIVQFLERSKVPPSTNTPVPDGSLPTESKRSRHLKQLALQVAYHLDWNLEALENGLTLQWQDYLFSQLLKIIPSAYIDGDLNSIDLRSAMALIIYHRWVIRTLAQHFLPNVGKVKNGTLEAATNDVILKTLKDQLPSSIQILEKALTITQDLELPCSPQQQQVSPQMTPPSLSSLAAAQTTQGGATQGEKEGKASCNGIADGEVVKSTVNGTASKIKQVKKEDIIAQVSFDLGTLYFYQEKFGDALKLFQHCKEAKRCKSSLYTVDECELHGYHMACCGILGEDVRHQWSRVASQGKVPLLEQVEQSKRSGNKDLVTLLLQDNIHTELPMDYRLSLAKEVPKSPVDSLATGESVTLACQVQACNTLRLIMEGKAIQHEIWDSLKTCSTEELRCLLSLCVKSTEIIKSTPLIADKDQHIRVLKSFVSLVCNSATKVNGAEVLQDEKFSLFAPAKKPDVVGDLKRKMPREPLQFKQLLEDFVSTGADLEYSNAIARLRACYDAQEISALVDKLRQLKPNRNLHNENFTCMLYKASLDEVKDSKLQDILHVLLTKAIHCSSIKEYEISVSLLRYALEQIEGLTLGPVERIRNSLHQELLVLDIKLNSGKNKNEDLSEQVKSYIWQTGKRTDLQPSIERHTVAYLLNNKETAFLTNLMNEMEDVHNTDYRLLGGLLATTCSSITKPQGWRKPVRQLWDGVLRVFSSTTQQKRPQEGPGISIRRDATNINLSGFLCFVDKITESSSLDLLISCLVRLHNLAKEGNDNHREVFSSLSHLWPTSVTNRSDVNFEHIDIALSHVTNHAITVEPHNTTWLHTQGDLYLDSRNYSAALKCYLKAGSISSLSFNQPVPPTVWDTQVFKKMVICCMSLKAHIQAALLCQCVDPVDFMTAFKAFQLAVVSSEDAMDKYYSMFWDVTMLEYLIYTHAKRGQQDKKHQAMQAISQVDINMYNSPDVLQHAEQTRKSALFRSLAKQYLKPELAH